MWGLHGLLNGALGGLTSTEQLPVVAIYTRPVATYSLPNG